VWSLSQFIITLFFEENTEVTIEKIDLDIQTHTVVAVGKMTTGKAWLLSDYPIEDPSHLVVKTPHAMFKIQGKTIGISIEENKTVVDAVDGKVFVKTQTSRRILSIAKGFKGIIQTPGDIFVVRDVTVPLNEETPEGEPLYPVTLEKEGTSIDPAASDGAVPTVLIAPVVSPIVERENMRSFTNYLTTLISDVENIAPMTWQEATEKISNTDVGGLLTCRSRTCLSRVASLAGAQLLLSGDIGKLGSQFVFTLQLSDAVYVKTVKMVSRTASADPGELMKQAPQMLDEIFTVLDDEQLVRSLIGDAALEKADPIEQMALIPAGTFSMGSKKGFGKPDEHPRHTVFVDSFYLDIHEVTNALFEKVMGFNPAYHKSCANCPVENVTWYEAFQFCKKMGKQLPTEAQWEYAARGGTDKPFHYGSSISSDLANFNGNYPYGGAPKGVYRKRTMPVGSFKPNTYGLYDMHGNVAEWCVDWYDEKYYETSPEENPAGPDNGTLKVIRGGSWASKGNTLRVYNRLGYHPDILFNIFGFRCARENRSSR